MSRIKASAGILVDPEPMVRSTAQFGFWFALVAFLAGAGYSVVQLLQVAGAMGWPLADILIYGFSFLIAWPFMLAILALHHLTAPERKIWSGAGLLFAAIYAAYVTPLYALQLGTAIPLALRGTPDALFAVHRYSLFWTLDGMGYIAMGLATLFAARAFAPAEKWAAGLFLANGLFTAVITGIYFYPDFSTWLLLLGTPWILTGPGSILMLALYFHRQYHAKA